MSNKGIDKRILFKGKRSRNRWGSRYTHRRIEEWEGSFIPTRIYRYIFNDLEGGWHSWGPVSNLVAASVGKRWDDVRSIVCSKAKGKKWSYDIYYLRYVLSRVVDSTYLFYEGEKYPRDSEGKELNPGDFYIDLEGYLRLIPRRKVYYHRKKVKVVEIGTHTFIYVNSPYAWHRDRWVNLKKGWYRECVWKDKEFTRRIALNEDGSIVWEGFDENGIQRPKIITEQVTKPRYEYYPISNTDLVKLRKGGYID